MNYLALVQRLHTETGNSGTPPQSVTGNTNLNNQLVIWIKDAWLQIQAERRWDFMRQTKTVVLTPGTSVYDIAQNLAGIPGFNWPDLGDVDRDNIIVTPPTANSSKYRMQFLEFREFSDQFDLAPVRSAYPTSMAIIPNFKMSFYPNPDLAYSIRFVYYTVPQALIADTDIPYMSDTSATQDANHMIIVWKALMYYADHNNIPDFKQAAAFKYDQILQRLQWREMPSVDYKTTPVA